jgi:hypothetical protein
MNYSDIKLLPELNASLDFTKIVWSNGKLLGWLRVNWATTPAKFCVHLISMTLLAMITRPGGSMGLGAHMLYPFRSTAALSLTDFSG